jgi:mono/diheme cytochrome c family protein
MSVYVEFALARTCNGLIEPRETTRYDRNVSRLLVVPLVLLFGIAGVTYALAKWHPARPGVPKVVAGSVVLGDQYRGQTAFQSSCSGCHGANGAGGVGPKLQDLPISIAAVKAQIDNGGGTMPAGVVKGGDEKDVLAYVATLIKPPPG